MEADLDESLQRIQFRGQGQKLICQQADSHRIFVTKLQERSSRCLFYHPNMIRQRRNQQRNCLRLLHLSQCLGGTATNKMMVIMHRFQKVGNCPHFTMSAERLDDTSADLTIRILANIHESCNRLFLSKKEVKERMETAARRTHSSLS